MSEAEKFFWLFILEADKNVHGAPVVGVSHANSDRAASSYSYLESQSFVSFQGAAVENSHQSWRHYVLTLEGTGELAELHNNELNIIEAAGIFAESINERQLFDSVRRSKSSLIAEHRGIIKSGASGNIDLTDVNLRRTDNIDASTTGALKSRSSTTVKKLLMNPIRKIRASLAAVAGTSVITLIFLAGDVLGLLNEFFSFLGM